MLAEGLRPLGPRRRGLLLPRTILADRDIAIRLGHDREVAALPPTTGTAKLLSLDPPGTLQGGEGPLERGEFHPGVRGQRVVARPCGRVAADPVGDREQSESLSRAERSILDHRQVRGPGGLGAWIFWTCTA